MKPIPISSHSFRFQIGLWNILRWEWRQSIRLCFKRFFSRAIEQYSVVKRSVWGFTTEYVFPWLKRQDFSVTQKPKKRRGHIVGHVCPRKAVIKILTQMAKRFPPGPTAPWLALTSVGILSLRCRCFDITKVLLVKGPIFAERKKD